MKERDELLRLMREYFKAPVAVFVATVKSVDEQNLTCSVEPVNGAVIHKVRLKAGVDQVIDGVVEFPKVDSSVLVGLIGNNETSCFIVKCSQVDKVVMFGGTKPLVNWPDVKEELDKNNEILQAMLDVLTGAPINEPGSGSPSALQAALKVALAGKDTGDFNDKEDSKVLH